MYIFASGGNRAFRSEGSNVYNPLYGNDICLCHESDGTRKNPGCFEKITHSISLSLVGQEIVSWFYKQISDRQCVLHRIICLWQAT